MELLLEKALELRLLGTYTGSYLDGVKGDAYKVCGCAYDEEAEKLRVLIVIGSFNGSAFDTEEVGGAMLVRHL